MITIANFEKYRKGDFYQFMVNVLEIVTTDRATTMAITAQRAALDAQVQLFADAYTPVIGSELTPQLAALDTQRDDALVGLKSVLEGYLKHFERAKRDSAFSLLDLMNGYGDQIYKLRYQLETATVSNLLNDWQSSHSAAITTLGIADWVQYLSEVNLEFNQFYLGRTQQIAGIESGALDALRVSTLDAYRLLKSHIEAHGLLTPSALNTQVQQEISSLASQYNDAVNRYTSNEETGDDTDV